jgi:hypothetical protein
MSTGITVLTEIMLFMIFADVSEELVVSILRIENYLKKVEYNILRNVGKQVTGYRYISCQSRWQLS